MGKSKKNIFNDSAVMNNIAYQIYYNKIFSLCCSRFQWSGLPESVNPQFMEKILVTQGKALFFKDDVIGELALAFNGQGQLNIYNEPTQRNAYASNGYRALRNYAESVIIWNNYIHQPDIILIKYYAARLWDLDRTMDVNARAQKTPALIQCDETQRLTLLNLYKEYDGNAPVIFGNRGLNAEGLTFISTAAPYVGDKLTEMKHNVWNECLTFLGIANVNFSKRANLVVDEVNRSMGGTVASRSDPLQERQMACEKINRMFGLNVKCEFISQEPEAMEENSVETEKRGAEL